MKAKWLAFLGILGLVLCVGGGGVYAAVMNTYTNETNLADDDEFLVWDTSEGTGTVNNITWSALKAEIAAEGYTLRLVAPSDDPDVSVTGQMSYDTDGWIRVFATAPGASETQKAAARTQEEIHVTVVKPQDMADAVRDAFLVWSNESGMTFTITGWKGWSGTDNTTLNIETTDGVGATNATVDAVEIASDGTGCFYASDSTITAATIANGSLIWLDFDDTDDPTYVKLVIYGYYSSDVN